MHDGMPYGRNQGQGQGHSREVDRQSPTGLIFFCLSLSEAVRGRRAVCSRGVQFELALRRGLWVDFYAVFSVFLEWICLSDALDSSNFRRQFAPQLSRNCGRKLRKVKISAQKFVTTSIQIVERFPKKIPPQYLTAINVDKFFPHVAIWRRQQKKFKVRIGSPTRRLQRHYISGNVKL